MIFGTVSVGGEVSGVGLAQVRLSADWPGLRQSHHGEGGRDL